jgi:hypothetical protein
MFNMRQIPRRYLFHYPTKMKRLLFSLIAAIGALVLPSCLQSETTIRLNKDGSGTIVEETTFGAQLIAMVEQMAALGAEGENPIDDLASEENAKTRASQLGEGVTLSGIEKVERAGAKGARVTYAFKDINKVRLNLGDALKSSLPNAEDGALEAVENEPPLTFTYADGKLTINVPQPEKQEGGPAGDAEDVDDAGGNPEIEAVLKQMLSDMKISLRVEIESGIAETNATHRDGNSITLMEMNMGELLKNEGALKKLSSLDQDDPGAAVEALKTLPGVKVEEKPKVEITLE